ncbi:hypothetical protein QOT17_011055 [Balamuthia mandrillaris]
MQTPAKEFSSCITRVNNLWNSAQFIKQVKGGPFPTHIELVSIKLFPYQLYHSVGLKQINSLGSYFKNIARLTQIKPRKKFWRLECCWK